MAARCGCPRSGAVRLSTEEGPGLRTAGAQAGPPAATLGPGLPRGEGSAPVTRGAGAPLKRPSGLLSWTGSRISSPWLSFSRWRAGAHSVASVSAVQPRERGVRARPPPPPEFLPPASRPYPALPRAPRRAPRVSSSSPLAACLTHGVSMLQGCSLPSPHPLLPPLHPQASPLCLCLFLPYE